MVWVLVLMMVYFSFTGPNFLTLSNGLNLAKQGATLLILCMGVIVVKITGGMDLSNGANISIAGMVMAWMLVSTSFPLSIAIAAAIITAVFFGLMNGFMVAKMKITPFVATLGSQGIIIGLSLAMNNGYVIGELPKSIRPIGHESLLGIPIPLIIAVSVLIITLVLLNKTKFGIYIYAIGGNEEALKLSGKSVNLYKIMAYAYSGFTAGIAALILTSRNMSAQPTIGLGMEFQSFAGVVLGGSYMAGRGTGIGAALGAIVIIILRNGLNLIGIPTYLQLAIFGSVLISAIIASTLVEQKIQKWTQ